VGALGEKGRGVAPHEQQKQQQNNFLAWLWTSGRRSDANEATLTATHAQRKPMPTMNNPTLPLKTSYFAHVEWGK